MTTAMLLMGIGYVIGLLHGAYGAYLWVGAPMITDEHVDGGLSGHTSGGSP